MDSDATRSPAPLYWLILGALAGLVIAAYGLLQRAPDDLPLPPGAVASVNGATISAAQYQRAADAFSLLRGEAPGNDDRARIITQLIEEELLVQRGIALDMPASEATVRAAIVQSMIASVTAEADAANPDDAELLAYLEAHPERYTFASALAVDGWIADDEQTARSTIETLGRGGQPTSDQALREVPGLPKEPLPIERLRMFVGPAIAAATAEMPVGQSAVFARQGSWYVLRVTEHADSVLADLDTIRSQVLTDYRQDLADRRLRAYLDDLLERSDVAVAAP